MTMDVTVFDDFDDIFIGVGQICKPLFAKSPAFFVLFYCLFSERC